MSCFEIDESVFSRCESVIRELRESGDSIPPEPRMTPLPSPPALPREHREAMR
jgi:hypothetical protein